MAEVMIRGCVYTAWVKPKKRVSFANTLALWEEDKHELLRIDCHVIQTHLRITFVQQESF